MTGRNNWLDGESHDVTPHHGFEAYLRRALGDATRGRLTAAGATVELDRGEIAALEAALTPVSPRLTTSCSSAVVAEIALSRARRPVAALAVHRDGSIGAAGFTLRVLVEDERRLVAWLGARVAGASGLFACPVGQASLRKRWLDAAPAALRDALLAAPSSCREPEGLAARLGAAGAALGEPRRLLEWHGAGDGPWTDMPPCTAASGSLVGAMPADVVLAVLESGAPQGALLRGAARFVGAYLRSWEEAEALRARLSPALWDSLLEETRRGGDPGAVARLELARSGRRAEPPPGALRIAESRRARFSALHADGVHACALDGRTLRWFSLDAGRSGQAVGCFVQTTAPIAVHAGAVFFNGTKRLDLRTGEVRDAPGPGLLRRALAREARRAAGFREEIVDRCLDHLGDAPLLVEPGEGAPPAWLVARPPRDDVEAWEAYAHLGGREPEALGLEHIWAARPGERVLHALPRGRRARRLSFRFEGELVAIAAGARGVHAVELGRGPGDASVWWELSADGARARRGELALPGASIRGLRALRDGILVRAAAPLGEVLLRLVCR
ncbi:hypothetical protein [Sorangium cellulosum]|nr:hypothetical protein [Sorangium cellulosum]